METEDKKKFEALFDKFMDFHDDYEDIIADCDKDAFELFYNMHHETFDYQTLRNRFFEMKEKFGSLLKSCSEEIYNDLEAIIAQL